MAHIVSVNADCPTVEAAPQKNSRGDDFDDLFQLTIYTARDSFTITLMSSGAIASLAKEMAKIGRDAKKKKGDK
ncbi:hypothetical protein [Fimbriiglobus ruber]|uniref:hypothetical protein n=1 Tax=Fimbriiglobus ruber TaxID=1908690 RepID=UPI000B4BB8B7|nr:hypothetical protein [Fimbriiglobus ruber]